ncbi:uncharacterized protein LOC142975167 [Anticarsia gemmatalis]|uniref:uncharacterized protein LOC142975167 n=1 Tax=Anticarsia gemmatalis TaxID=129554 RepID=UPI003F76A5EB
MLVPTCLVKFCELALTVACVTLHHYSYDLTDVPTLVLCSGTYIGYLVVLTGEIVGEMLLAPLDLVQDMYFGILGVGMFATSGSMVMSNRVKNSLYPRMGDHNSAILLASLSLLNALFMFLDLSMAYFDSEEFDEEASV